MDANNASNCNALRVNSNPLINNNNNNNNNNLTAITTTTTTTTTSSTTIPTMTNQTNHQLIGNSNTNNTNNNNVLNSHTMNNTINNNINKSYNNCNHNNNHNNIAIKSQAIIKDKTIDTNVRQMYENSNKLVPQLQGNHKQSSRLGPPPVPSPRHRVSSSAVALQPPSVGQRRPQTDGNSPMDLLMDRTPCGSESLTPSGDESYETPPHIRWSQDFYYLIDDEEGVALFREYLRRESGLDYLLDFWFACRGRKSEEDKERIGNYTRVIFKTYIRKSMIKCISNEVREALLKELGPNADGDGRYDRNVFDAAQQEVEDQLKGSIYVNFLRSDIYLDYYHKNSFPDNQCDGGATGGVYDDQMDASAAIESSLDDYNPRNQLYEVLPTLHEEHELNTTPMPLNVIGGNSAANIRSQANRKFADDCHNLMSSGSRDTLNRRLNSVMASRRSAANTAVTANSSSPPSRLTTEPHPINPSFSRLPHPGINSYMRSKSMANPPNPYHVTYAPNLPPSAQDSEVSTNDSASCVSSQDGVRVHTKKYISHQTIQQNAKMNANAAISHNKIYAMRAHRGQQAAPTPPLKTEDFAKILIEKLEKCRLDREQEQQNETSFKDKLAEIIIKSETGNVNNTDNGAAGVASRHSGAKAIGRPTQAIKDVFKQKLDFCSPPGDNGQDILDKHIAQVFADTPIVTPTDSVGGRCVSPPKNSYLYNSFVNNPNNGNPITGASGGVGVTAPMPSMAVNYQYDPSGGDKPSIMAILKYSTEKIPFRLPITGLPPITFRKFKAQIPAKRGHWQYYFKRQCSEREAIDISANHVLELITDDNALLPLIKNQIYAEICLIKESD